MYESENHEKYSFKSPVFNQAAIKINSMAQPKNIATSGAPKGKHDHVVNTILMP